MHQLWWNRSFCVTLRDASSYCAALFFWGPLEVHLHAAAGADWCTTWHSDLSIVYTAAFGSSLSLFSPLELFRQRLLLKMKFLLSAVTKCRLMGTFISVVWWDWNDLLCIIWLARVIRFIWAAMKANGSTVASTETVCVCSLTLISWFKTIKTTWLLYMMTVWTQRQTVLIWVSLFPCFPHR